MFICIITSHSFHDDGKRVRERERKKWEKNYEIKLEIQNETKMKEKLYASPLISFDAVQI